MAALVVAGVAIVATVIVIRAALSSFSWRIIILTSITLAMQLAIFITVRHIQLLAVKRNTNWPRGGSSPKGRVHNDDYHLFVLGSGGHTKEMLMMMDDGTCDFGRSAHRRYLISSGDATSAHHMRDYEAGLAALCAVRGTQTGTHDAVLVTRARRVHQSILTTPWTAMRSVLDILPALLVQPSLRESGGGSGSTVKRYPSLVFSNGPATGFFVAVTIHLLKVFHVVPEETMRIVYIESWARISTLSLTGKLFLYTGLADFLAVQHKEVAAKYGIRDVGQMVFNARRDNI